MRATKDHHTQTAVGATAPIRHIHTVYAQLTRDNVAEISHIPTQWRAGGRYRGPEGQAHEQTGRHGPRGPNRKEGVKPLSVGPFPLWGAPGVYLLSPYLLTLGVNWNKLPEHEGIAAAAVKPRKRHGAGGGPHSRVPQHRRVEAWCTVCSRYGQAASYQEI